VLGCNATDGDGGRRASSAKRGEAINPDCLGCVGLRSSREHGPDANVIRTGRVSANRGADDKRWWAKVPERSDGHVVSPDMNSCRATRERDVGAVVDDHGNGERRDQRTPDVDECPSIGALEPKLHHGRAPSNGGPRPSHQPIAPVTQIVGNRDQREIERFASLCSENVSLNS
jgi:hypothetical protein